MPRSTTIPITQTDFIALAGRRLVPLLRRVPRTIAAGGVADPAKHPYTWSVEVDVDGQTHVLYSARGLRREWSDLNVLVGKLREWGFREWTGVDRTKRSR